MLFKLLSYLPPIAGLLLIGTVTYLKNARDALNVRFFFLAVTLAAWLVALCLGDLATSQTSSLWAIRAAVGVGTLIVPSLLYFSVAFPRLRPVKWYFHVLTLLPAIFFIAISPTPLLIPAVELQQLSAQPTHLNFLYTLQSIYVIVGFATAFALMLQRWHRSTPREREQIKLVILGLCVALLINIVVGFVLEMAGQANNYSNLAGNLSLVLFIGTISYAVVKHRLFDIRLAISRALGFVLTVVILSAAYSLLILAVGIPIVANGSFALVHDNRQLFILLPPTIVAALTFHRLERFMAQITRNIFYQDSYDTRVTLDAFSDALLSGTDIDSIMEKGLAVLADAVRPAHILFVVLDNDGNVYRQRVVNRQLPEHTDKLLTELRRIKARMIVKDELPASQWPSQFESDDVSLVLRLGAAKNMIGAVFLGPKQNGRIYSAQDAGLLNVSAKNFAIAIENAKKYEQIAAFADTLREEVAHATSRLRHANAELKTLDAMKDEFISMASHQLRSPATSVHEAIQMMNQDYLTDHERGRILQLAEASSERLVNVIADMLSIARIQAGHFTLEKTEVEMGELVERAILETSGLASQKSVQVHFNHPSEPIKLMADRAKLNEIMANYLENAIKYSDEGGPVVVALAREEGKVRFEVSDAGIGVPTNERKKLFNKFFRATNARQEQPNGNGIGLFVVRTVAQEHGGDAYYEPLESGSRFGFWLPS